MGTKGWHSGRVRPAMRKHGGGNGSSTRGALKQEGADFRAQQNAAECSRGVASFYRPR
jgi:hypothetical protein